MGRESSFLPLPAGVRGAAARVASAGAIAAIAACSSGAPGDDAASQDNAIYGYLDEGPDELNTHVVGTVAYEQRASFDCVNATIQHPSLKQYQPVQRYCAVKFAGGQFDKIRVSVQNKDDWGTNQIEAYLFDDQFKVEDPYNAVPHKTLAQAKFVGDRNGNNTGKPIEFQLIPGTQLKKSGTYYVVFTKYAIRDYTDLTKYKTDDAFSVQVDATPAARLPLSLDRPPVASGFYSSANGNYVIDVVPPAASAAKDFQAWRAHLYAKRDGCNAEDSMRDFADLDCDATSCWFYGGRSKSGVGNATLRPGASAVGAVDYSDSGNPAVKLQFARAADPVELRGYETRDGCKITCPPTPTQPHYDNPCAGAGAPGWCFPGWEPPFGFESPLVLNVSGGDKIEFLGKAVPFDLDGHGAHPADWVSPAHPFLALDLDGDGAIGDGRELFGTATVIKKTGATATDGFSALAQYDDNGDGRIDQNDAVSGRLLLWFDRNSNGLSEPSELSSLSLSGVDSIDLKAQSQPPPSSANSGAFITFTSSFAEHVCSSATKMLIADVWFPTSK